MRIAKQVFIGFVAAVGISGMAAAASIPMLEFPVMNPTGTTYKMADHTDGVFVFEAYGINCSYCNQNAPAVDDLADQFADEPRVQVIDLGQDSSSSDYARWISAHHPNHPVVKDTSHKVYNAFKTQDVIPQTFVVNCKGELVGRTIGSWDSSTRRKVEGYITTALGTTCSK